MTDALDKASADPDDLPDDIDIDERRPVRQLVGLGLAGLAILLLLYLSPLRGLVGDLGQLRLRFRDGDHWAELAFVGLTALGVAAGAPRLVIYLAAGAVFGFIKGLILAQLAAIAGAVGLFGVLRHTGREALRQRLARFPRLARRLEANPTVSFVVFIRQLPVHSSLLTAALALSDVTVRTFLLGTFIGFLPQGTLAAMIGAGVGDPQYLPWVGLCVALAIAVSVILKKRKRPN